MRILMTASVFYPAVAGAGVTQAISSLAQRFMRHGHQVIVYASNLLDLERSHSDRTFVQDFQGMRVIYFKSVLRYRWQTFSPDLFVYCYRELRDFDIVHAFGYRDSIATIVCIFARYWRIPYIIEPCGSFIPRFRSVTKKRLFDFVIGGWLVAGAQRLVATSELERAELLSCGIPDEKIALIPDRIDLTPFAELPPRGRFRARYQIPNSERILLFLGRLSRRKGLDLLMRAFSDLGLPQVRLVIVGPDDEAEGYLSELHQLKKELGLEDRVHFLGPLVGSAKIEALTDADILILPSEGAENFGKVAAEAVAAGTPVVVTEACGIAPLIKQRVGLVVPFAQSPIRDALYELLTNKALYERFVANCPLVTQEFSWDEPAEQLEALYLQVTQDGGDNTQ